MPDSWAEYLLFNPYKGFRYLTEYDGHWNDVSTRASALPEPSPRWRKPPGAILMGRNLRTFRHGAGHDDLRAGRISVAGAASARQRGVKDFIAPPQILSSEIDRERRPPGRSAST